VTVLVLLVVVLCIKARNEGGGLSATLHAQLGQQTRHVVLDGLLGQVQALADLTVRQTLTDEFKDATLLLGQVRQAGVLVVATAQALKHTLGCDRVEQ
jgi:hypothetical protein